MHIGDTTSMVEESICVVHTQCVSETNPRVKDRRKGGKNVTSGNLLPTYCSTSLPLCVLSSSHSALAYKKAGSRTPFYSQCPPAIGSCSQSTSTQKSTQLRPIQKLVLVEFLQFLFHSPQCSFAVVLLQSMPKTCVFHVHELS